MIPDFLTIAEAARLIESRKLSPVELTENCLKRIETYDNKLNSFIIHMTDEALNTARQAEKEIAAGNYKGPLHGIPLGVKDVYETAGIATTCHSKLLQNYIPNKDAYSITQLKKAGAIILGKLALHEFAFGGPSFDLPWPPARNPWDTSCFTGGSSSGSGAAVAAGLILGSIGSDTGGSIRTPAAYCGIAGLKPTYGLVSLDGAFKLAQSLDHAGPMAWTSEDCAILLQGMVGFENTKPNYSKALNQNVKGIRLGLLRHFYTTDNPVNEETRNAIDSAANKFREIGCEVNEITLPPLSEWAACGMIIMLAEAFQFHKQNLQTRFMDYGEVFRGRLAIAGLISHTDYQRSLKRRQELINKFNHAMQNFDVILTATTNGVAPKINAINKFAILEKPLLTIPFNITGSPAISICCGYSENGLPLAMQIIGKCFDDGTVLRVAAAYECATSWRERRPMLSH